MIEFIKTSINSDSSLYVGITESYKLPISEFEGYKIDKIKILCLCYEVGVGFHKHSHIPIDKSHLFDFIIYPPSNNSFEGGDLIIYHKTHTEIINTDKLNEWKVVKLNMK